jgi:hypothetical protein
MMQTKGCLLKVSKDSFPTSRLLRIVCYESSDTLLGTPFSAEKSPRIHCAAASRNAATKARYRSRNSFKA